MSSPKFNKVVIYGVGLMGGSLGLALQQQSLAHSVWGLGRNPERLEQARSAGIITHATTNRKEAAQEADLIVVGLPVRQIVDAVLALAVLAPPECVITDLGSTKSEVVRGIDKHLRRPGTEFVGSHPMCGSEQSGWEASRADLYRDATCVVTPSDQTNPEACKRICDLWEILGGRLLILSPEDHDRLAARTSHLPRLVSSALCHALEHEMEAEERDRMVATGFLGTTRTALSDPDMWLDIFDSNREYVLDALGDLRSSLQEIHELIAKRNEKAICEWLQEAQTIRRRLIRNSSKSNGGSE